jgi:hypothetical protein
VNKNVNVRLRFAGQGAVEPARGERHVARLGAPQPVAQRHRDGLAWRVHGDRRVSLSLAGHRVAV